MINRTPLRFFLEVAVLATLCSVALGQSQTSTPETQVWPEVDAHIQLPSHLRVLAIGGTEQAIDFPFQQWYTGAALGYQFKPILRSHVKNIDPDKEHYFLFGAGYEFLKTHSSGKVSDENRITIDGTPTFPLLGKLLVRDRNWVELRWINGTYSTTYRNFVTVEHEFRVRGLRFSPTGGAEAFYDGSKRSWDQEWYTAGIQLPYRSLLMVETYYRREHCDSCHPVNGNVGGVSLNFYFGNSQ
jgi:hypothetical protein